MMLSARFSILGKAKDAGLGDLFLPWTCSCVLNNELLDRLREYWVR